MKNVIPEGKYLNISVKGSGADDAFTVDNGGSEVLNYDVSDDNGAVGVNGNVLSVPAGTNTATQNMNFKLNTKKGSAEVAGQYNGRVIYNASVGDKNGGTTSGTAESYSAGDTLDIEGTKYVVLEQKENNQALVMTASSIGERAFQWNYDENTSSRPDCIFPFNYFRLDARKPHVFVYFSPLFTSLSEIHYGNESFCIREPLIPISHNLF